MVIGGYHTAKLGPMYTHATNSMRRKPIITALALLVLIALFFAPRTPEGISSYAHVKIPTTFTDAVNFNPRPISGFSDEFPKKIWQTGSESMKEKWAAQTETWTSMNEEWNYELLTGPIPLIFYFQALTATR